jgi:hypothetical protein
MKGKLIGVSVTENFKYKTSTLKIRRRSVKMTDYNIFTQVAMQGLSLRFLEFLLMFSSAGHIEHEFQITRINIIVIHLKL